MSGVELPKGWVKAELNNVLLSVIGGGTPSKNNNSYYQGNIPWMSVKDMNKNTLMDTVDHITQEAVDNSSTNIIPAGTPIIATRMSLGKIVIATFDSAINQDLKALFLPQDIERDFFVHWYRSQSQLIERLGTGTTVKGIRLEVLNALIINLPPLNEQKIIAEKLDTLLTQVDNTKTRLEQIPKILKRFRQATLTAAVKGNISHEWRKEAVYKAINRTFYEITSDAQVGLVRSSSEQSDICNETMKTPYIKMNNIGNEWGVSLSKLAYVSCSKEELKKYSLLKNDWIFNTRNSNELVGKSCVWTCNKEAIYNNNILRIRLKNNFNPNFLNYWFHSGHGISQLQSIKSATTNVAAIYQKELFKLTIPFPPIEEQQEIVRRVEQLFALADTVEKQVNAALDRVNNLTQAILAKAFHGELTAQWREENPDLISGENSAAALLERIKAERAASGTKKTSRKKS